MWALLLLTPKILSLPFDPQDSAFLSWAHSYAAFHNHCIPQSTAGSVEHSPLHQWKASHGGHHHFKERTFSKSVNTFDNNNHMWCLFIVWWHLTILKWPGATLCALTMDIMWLLILIIHCLCLMTIFATQKKINGSRCIGFLPDVYQIWDEIIWLTPEKGRLISSSPPPPPHVLGTNRAIPRS